MPYADKTSGVVPSLTGWSWLPGTECSSSCNRLRHRKLRVEIHRKMRGWEACEVVGREDGARYEPTKRTLGQQKTSKVLESIFYKRKMCLQVVNCGEFCVK